MIGNPPWTAEDRDDLRFSLGSETVNEIANRQGRTPGSVVLEARMMGLDVDPIGKNVDGEIESWMMAQQDAAFCTAMVRAVEQGLERPPMIGIDRQPGTKCPRPIQPNTPVRYSSSAATCADL